MKKIAYYIIAIWAILMPSTIMAQSEPYAVLSDDNTKLTFYFDDQKAARNGMSVGSFDGTWDYDSNGWAINTGWDEQKEKITTVVFDKSFANCETITSTAWWFCGFKNLTTITDLSYLKTDNVTNMSNMFRMCWSLTNLDVSSFKTDNVTSMGSMFHGCTRLTSLDMSGLNAANASYMSYMFADCFSLKSLNLSGFKIDNATWTNHMFASCSRLTSLDLSSFDTNNVTDMSAMFRGCSILETIYVSDDWSTEKVTESSEMFKGCVNLAGGMGTQYDESHIDHTYAHIDEGESYPGYFTRSGSQSLAKRPYAVLSDDNTKLTFYYDDQKAERNGMSVGPFDGTWDYDLGTYIINSGWYDQRENIATVEFDASFANCNTITSTACWFYGCKNLKTITNISNLKTDNVTDMWYMFRECSGLTSLDLSGFKTDKVTRMTGMFQDCSGLKTLDISGFNTENVTNMSWMFVNCSSLTSLNVSGFKTDNVTNMSVMFHGCFGLTKLDLSGFNTEKVTDMSWMFNGCSSLTSLNVSGFKTDNVTDMSYMFRECSGLTSLDLSGFKTDKVTRMNGMFKDCSGLKTLDISGFNTEKVTDMSWMFNGCSKLETIYVSNEWSAANVTVSENMFNWCTNLVGGMGTKYDSNHTDCAYAHIDEGEANPGYFTRPGKFRVTISATGNGSVNFYNNTIRNQTTTFSMDADASATISLTPDEGYKVKSFIVNSNDVTSDIIDNQYTISNISANKTIEVEFKTIAEPYAVLSDNNTKLTFYYDDQKAARNGMSVGSFDGTWDYDSNGWVINTGWYDQRENIVTVEFDSSFANCNTITSTAWWFNGCKNLKTITNISNLKTDNVTNMGWMFGGCSGLTDLDVSTFNTANVEHMEQMFEWCTSLPCIDLSGFNTSKVTNMYGMFSCSSKLETIYVGSEWSTDNVTQSNYMFYNCTNLVGGMGTMFDSDHTDHAYAHIDEGESNPGYFTRSGTIVKRPYAVLSDNNTKLTFYYDDQKTARNGMSIGTFTGTWDNNINMFIVNTGWDNQREQITTVVFDKSFANCETIKSTAWWFYGLKNLTTITDFSNLKTNNVTDMSWMFDNCSGLTDLDVSTFNTANVEHMEHMFDSCTGLTNLDLSGFNTENVKYMYCMFQSCSGLSSINLSGLNTINVTHMDYMFTGCSSLKSLDLSWFKTDNVITMRAMFPNCSSLISLDLSGFNTENVENMASMFSGCSGLTSLDLSGFKTEKVTGMDWMFQGCSGLKTLDISGFNTENVTDMVGMFYDCSGLTSLDVSGFKTDNVTDMRYMFKGCSSLTSLDVSGFKTDNVTDMSDMFHSCSSLTSLDVSGFKTDNVTYMNDMFHNCSSLTSLNVSNFKTDKVTKISGMFLNCSNLTDLDVSGFRTDNVSVIVWMFYGCSNLASLDVSNFFTDNVADISYMFGNCSSLTSLDLSGFNTNNVTQMVDLFQGCSKLETIYVSNEWSTEKVTESDNMFSGCTSLVGGMGTKYDSNHTDHTYAHIDEGEANPGYFTRVGTYKLSISAKGNGSVSFDNNAIRNQTSQFTVESKKSATITMTPDEGYRIKSVKVGSTDVTSSVSDNQYTISSISSNTTVEVEFEAIPPTTYTLSIKATGNGKVTYGSTDVRGTTTSFTINEGTSVTISFVPDDGYRIKSVKVGSTDVTSSVSNNQYTISSISSNTSVEVEFEAIPPTTYTLSIKATGNGKVTYGSTDVRGTTTSFTINEGTSVTISFTPDEDSRIKSVIVSSTDVTSSITDNTYTISNINNDTNVEVEFVEDIKSVSNSGVNFSVVSQDEKTVNVSSGDYKLVLEVPASFTAKNKEWNVVGIDKDALKDNSELAAIIWNPEVKFTEKVNNPNLLLYVKSTDYAPNDIKNVIANNKAKNITLVDAANGNNFYCPQEFAVEQITYEHNYSMKTGYNTCQGWETIVLPFDVTVIINNVGTELVPYPLWARGDSKRPFWLYSMNEDGWKSESAIKANTPYIISMPNNDNYDATYNISGNIVFSASNVKVEASENMSSSKSNHKNLVPNYQNQESSNDIYALNVNNLWDKNTDSELVEGSAFVRGLRQVRPFEAYMTIDSGGTSTRSISIYGDGTATGIMDIPTSESDGVIKVYSLSGAQIKQGKRDDVMKNLPKGIYIINNKKVVIK